jgi:cytoplasmic iron level regulating protein YaaA (DUF328/UPF0246 family)
MLLVVSPAKTLDFESPSPALPVSKPVFAKDAVALAGQLRGMDARAVGKLMDISPDLAALNVERFQSFSARPAAARQRPAVLAFRGDTYIGMRAETFDAPSMDFAQQHLRILSGLYGVLRPLDLIQPYRLEMGSALANARGNNLYAYWGDRIAKELRKQATATATGVLVNLASQEYFGAVDTKALGLRVVTPQFKEQRGGVLKIISFSAKRARGAMAGFAIRNRLEEPEALKAFAEDNYRFRPELSSADEWVFAR